MAILARSGSGSSWRSRLSTEIRSPDNGCFLLSNQPQPASPSENSKRVTTKVRIIPGIESSLGGERRCHFGGTSTQALRRRQIVGEALVEIERAGFVP